MTKKDELIDDAAYKAGDVVEVTMSIEPIIPPGVDEFEVTDWSGFDEKCEVSYSYPRVLGCAMNEVYIDAGIYPGFDDIKDYLEKYATQDLDDVAEFEIFDVHSSNYEFQTAKIRIKALKEELKED